MRAILPAQSSGWHSRGTPRPCHLVDHLHFLEEIAGSACIAALSARRTAPPSPSVTSISCTHHLCPPQLNSGPTILLACCDQFSILHVCAWKSSISRPRSGIAFWAYASSARKSAMNRELNKTQRAVVGRTTHDSGHLAVPLFRQERDSHLL